MGPGVSALKRQPISEPTIDPNLQRMVTRIARGLAHGNRADVRQYATVVDDANQFVSERSSNPRVGKDKSQMEDNDKREVTTNKVFE